MTAVTREVVLSRAARVGRLYTRHRDTVFRLALRYGAGDVAWAEDVTHDVFVRLLGAIDRLRDDDDLASWFYRVTTNQCLNRLKRDRLRSSLMGLFPLLASKTPTPERTALARNDLERTMEVLRGLPAKERIAFLMLHLDGKTQNEIAEIMGHSKGYVSKLLRRASEYVRSAGYEVPE